MARHVQNTTIMPLVLPLEWYLNRIIVLTTNGISYLWKYSSCILVTELMITLQTMRDDMIPKFTSMIPEYA